MMKKLRVDTGAIKFVLAGADVMCPGLTSPGATMHDQVWQPSSSPVLQPVCKQQKQPQAS